MTERDWRNPQQCVICGFDLSTSAHVYSRHAEVQTCVERVRAELRLVQEERDCLREALKAYGLQNPAVPRKAPTPVAFPAVLDPERVEVAVLPTTDAGNELLRKGARGIAVRRPL